MSHWTHRCLMPRLTTTKACICTGFAYTSMTTPTSLARWVSTFLDLSIHRPYHDWSIYLKPLLCSLIRLIQPRVLLSLVMVSERSSSHDSLSLTYGSHHFIVQAFIKALDPRHSVCTRSGANLSNALNLAPYCTTVMGPSLSVRNSLSFLF